MPTLATFKYGTKHKNIYLRVAKGHFATSHSHSNYYIDVVAQKSRLSESKAVAEELYTYYKSEVIDTILCLDGIEVVSTCLADKLTERNFVNMNAHKTIYIVTPEISNGQLLFRHNIIPMIQNKNVLILAVSVATGYTVKSAIRTVRYYGGTVQGVSSIFATKEECAGFAVNSVFDPKDLNDYVSFSSHEFPMCKNS